MFGCIAASNESKHICHSVTSAENFLIPIWRNFMQWFWYGVGERTIWGMSVCITGGVSVFNMIESILIMTFSVSISESSALF